ncbi:MAG: cobyric acid synthase [Salinarchaeum sp.]
MSDASTLLVAGTASHVGKSTVTAGLCRLLADRGVDVVPFKAQNMSNNARAVPKATTDGTGEIGVAQFVQSKAARQTPTTDVNPVLLKPQGTGESQLVLNGEAQASGSARKYYEEHWETARNRAIAAWERLAAEHEVVLAEGAGSIAEINLYEQDLANIETARFADAAILLVADIERGGVFASILGTVELLPEDLRDRVVGIVITKFRGDESLLRPGINQIEERTGMPVLGVIPYADPGLPEEDSLALPGPNEQAVYCASGDDAAVTIVVPRLPRIANFTDLDPLTRVPGVQVSYRPLTASLADADAVVLPGSKNTVDDGLALQEAGLAERIADFEGPIVGLCGGYQLLGEQIENAALEGSGDRSTVPGIGRLPVVTRFNPDKRVEATELELTGTGPLAGASGRVEGYEIHAGSTRAVGSVKRPFAPPDGKPTATLGAAKGAVVGTYLHGLFENIEARRAFLETVFEAAGASPPSIKHQEQTAYDRAAALVSENIAVAELSDRADLPLG